MSVTLGVVLAVGAASALAGKQDRVALERCKADLDAVHGDGTRARLRSIKRGDGETDFRLMVTAGRGANHVVVCTVTGEGISSLADQDGMALRPAADAEKAPVTLTKAR